MRSDRSPSKSHQFLSGTLDNRIWLYHILNVECWIAALLVLLLSEHSGPENCSVSGPNDAHNNAHENVCRVVHIVVQSRVAHVQSCNVHLHCVFFQTLNLETEGASRRWPQWLDTSSQSWLANEDTAADEHECEWFLRWNAYHQIDSRVDGEHWMSTVEGGARIRYFFLIFPFTNIVCDVAEIMLL